MNELEMLRVAAHNLNDELVKYKNLYTQSLTHLRALMDVDEWIIAHDKDEPDDERYLVLCPFCGHTKIYGHENCPRQAAVKWLEENTDA